MKKTYTKKQITEAILHWKKQLKMMNEATGYEAFIGPVGINTGDDLTKIYNKYLYAPGRDLHDNMRKLLASQMKEFWRKVWRSAPNRGFQCFAQEIDCKGVTGFGYDQKEYKQFDGTYHLVVVLDHGENEQTGDKFSRISDEEYDDWKHYVEEYFDRTTSSKFGFKAELVFGEKQISGFGFTAVAAELTVTDPKLLAKLIDPDQANHDAAVKAGTVVKKDDVENGDDLAEMCKKKTLGSKLRDKYRSVIEKVNKYTASADEYSCQGFLKLASDPKVTYAVVLACKPYDVGPDGSKKACEYAAKMLKDKAGLDVTFDSKGYSDDKYATKVVVVDADKFNSLAD